MGKSLNRNRSGGPRLKNPISEAEPMQDAFAADQLKSQRVLWLTVVERAMRDTMEPKPSVRQSAIDWLLRDQVDFPQICELAGLDSGYLRKKFAAYSAAT